MRVWQLARPTDITHGSAHNRRAHDMVCAGGDNDTHIIEARRQSSRRAHDKAGARSR